MREEAQNGEFPILGAAGVLDYEVAKILAQSFVEVYSGTTNIEDLL